MFNKKTSKSMCALLLVLVTLLTGCNNTGISETDTTSGIADTAAPSVTEEETDMEPVTDPYEDAGASGTEVLYAKDFGAVGDGVHDDGLSISEAIKTAAERHATLIFEAGKHYYISETGATNGFESPFNLNKANNITIDGAGSVFVMAPGCRYLMLASCSNIKIINCKFDYAVSVYLIGKVTSVSGKTVEYDVDIEPYKSSFDFASVNGFSIAYNKGVQNRPHMFMQSMKTTGARHVSVVYKSHNYKVGDTVFLPNPGIGHNFPEMMNISGSTGGIVLENIDIHQVPCFSVVFKNNNAEIFLNNFNLIPSEENDREIKMVAWRDGFHCKDNRKPIHWDNCRVDVLFDDVFNISDTLGYINFVNNDKDFNVINYEHQTMNQTVAFDCRAGDVLDMYELRTGRYFGYATVRDTVANDDGSTRVIMEYGSKFSTVKEGYLVSNRNTCAPGSTITNSTFTGTYRFLRDIRIENCTFDNLITWIMVEGSVEGPLPGNIDYVNCTINGGEIQIDAFDRNRSAFMGKIGRQIKDIGFWGCTFNGSNVTTSTNSTYTISDTYTEADLYTVKNKKTATAVNITPSEEDFSGYMVTYDWYRHTMNIQGGSVVKLSRLKKEADYNKLYAAAGFSDAVLKLESGGDTVLDGLSKATLPFLYTSGKTYLITFDYYVKTASGGGLYVRSGNNTENIGGELFKNVGIQTSAVYYNCDSSAESIAFICGDGGEIYIGNIDISVCDDVNPTYLQLRTGYTVDWNGDVTVGGANPVKVSDIKDNNALTAISSDKTRFGETVLHLNGKPGEIKLFENTVYYLKYLTYGVSIDAYVSTPVKSGSKFYLLALDSTPSNKIIYEGLFGKDGLCHIEFDWTVGNTGEYALSFFTDAGAGKYPDVYIGNMTFRQSRSPRPSEFLIREDYHTHVKTELGKVYTYDFTEGKLFDFGEQNYTSLETLGWTVAERMKAAGFGDTAYYFGGNVSLVSLADVAGSMKPMTIKMKIYDLKGNIATSGARGAFVLLNMTDGKQNSAEVNYNVRIDPNDSRIVTIIFTPNPPPGTNSLLLYCLTGCEFYIGEVSVR